jgi:hypothetical protein
LNIIFSSYSITYSSYYLEAVASKNANVDLKINAKMLDTNLVDIISANVLNEIQEIEIKSTIVSESFVNYTNIT